VAWDAPAFTQLVSEARQNSSTRSGTVSSAAIVSVVGALAMITSAHSAFPKLSTQAVKDCSALPSGITPP
jgi:hypothetical protein